ncbi:MAG: S8 family serine peptidase [Patescibacteria group bacterium]|nr:S8 family serine peptidase [Patescibacteria group bacterium]
MKKQPKAVLTAALVVFSIVCLAASIRSSIFVARAAPPQDQMANIFTSIGDMFSSVFGGSSSGSSNGSSGQPASDGSSQASQKHPYYPVFYDQASGGAGALKLSPYQSAIAPANNIVSYPGQKPSQSGGSVYSGSAKDASVVPDEYIVELRAEPVAVTYARLKAQAGAGTKARLDVKSQLAAQSQAVQSEQDSFLASLPGAIQAKNKSVGRSVMGPKAGTTKRFKDVINAVVLNMNGSEAAAVKGMRDVKRVVPVGKVRATLMDSVPLINAPQVWAGNYLGNPDGSTGKGVSIAIIDTGVDYLHPDLGGCFGTHVVNGTTTPCKVVGGYNFVNNTPDPMDDQGHGTHVADIAAGNGMPKGVAPGASIYAYKVLDSRGSGDWTTVIAGIERATDPNNNGDVSDHLDIASLSLGGPGTPDDPVAEAVDNAVAAGVVVTVAAGNDGPNPNTIDSPGTAADAITVAATDKSDNRAWFSSAGPVEWTDQNGFERYLMKPDVAAPGVNICAARFDHAFEGEGDANCYHDNLHIALSGTSMATPHVAGEAALILQLHPDWSPALVKDVIMHSSNMLRYTGTGWWEAFGSGRIDAMAATSGVWHPSIARLDALPIGQNKISITGSAAGLTPSSFSRYTISYAEGLNPTHQFVPIYSSSKPVTDGVLYSGLDTTMMNEGVNMMKLAVFDLNGDETDAYQLLNVDNIGITAVGRNQNYANGDPVPIFGFSVLQGVTSYRVVVDDPNNGKTVCNVAAVQASVICSPSFKGLQDGIHSLYLEAQYKGSWRVSVPFKFAYVQELMSGWPQTMPGWARGMPEVIHQPGSAAKLAVPYYTDCSIPGVCGGPPTILYYSADGAHTLVSSLSNGDRMPDDWMAAQVHMQQGNAIAAAEAFGDNRKAIFKPDGQVISSWGAGKPVINSDFTVFNRDGSGLGLYAVSQDMNTGAVQINGYDLNGNALKGFPINVPMPYDIAGTKLSPSPQPTDVPLHQIAFLHPVFISGGKQQNLAVVTGTYTGSGQFFNDLKLYVDVFSAENQLIKTEKLFDGTGKSYILMGSYPIAADLHGDGKTEMIFGFTAVDAGLFKVNMYDLDAYTTYMTELDSSGNVLALSKPIRGYIMNQLAVGDIGNGAPDIVAVLGDSWASMNDQIAGFDSSLNSIFTHTENDRIEGISLADVEGTGSSQIIASYNNINMDGSPSGIEILNGSGSVTRNIVIPTMGAQDQLTAPLVDSLNGDADVFAASLEIPENFHSGFGNTYNMNLYALDVGRMPKAESPKAPSPSPTPTAAWAGFDWPSLLSDYHNTGCYHCAAWTSFGQSIATTTATTSSAASVTVASSSLALQYDPSGHEATLVATFKVDVSAGSADLIIPAYFPFNLYATDGRDIMSDQEQFALPPGVTSDNLRDTIPAGSTAEFTVTMKMNPKIMFPGSYKAILDRMWTIDPLGRYNYISVPTPNSTDPVTIIGELSPYIFSIAPNPVPADQPVTVTGVRFVTSGMNQITLTDPRSQASATRYAQSSDGKSMRFVPNADPGYYNVQVVNQKTGNSNMVPLQVTAPLVAASPTPLPSDTSSPQQTSAPAYSATPVASPTPSPSYTYNPIYSPVPTYTYSPTYSPVYSSPTPVATPASSPTAVSSPAPAASPSSSPVSSPSASPTPSPVQSTYAAPSTSPSASPSPSAFNGGQYLGAAFQSWIGLVGTIFDLGR